MMRLLIYVLLFPLLCVLFITMVVGSPGFDEMPGLLASAYVLGFVPSLLLAGIDYALKPVWAVPSCAALGFATLYGVMFLLVHASHDTNTTLSAGAIGALAAVVCWAIAR